MGSPVQYLASHQSDAKRRSLFLCFLFSSIVYLGWSALHAAAMTATGKCAPHVALDDLMI